MIRKKVSWYRLEDKDFKFKTDHELFFGKCLKLLTNLFSEKKGKDDEGKEGGRRRIGFGDDDDDVRFEKVQNSLLSADQNNQQKQKQTSLLPTDQNNQGGHPWRQQLLTDIFKATNVFKRWKGHSVNVEAQGKQ